MKRKKGTGVTCSENSATSMKSVANWAEELQGFSGGRSGSDSSSGRSSWSSSSPKPSAAVKASRSGDPIILDPWALHDLRRAEHRRFTEGTPQRRARFFLSLLLTLKCSQFGASKQTFATTCELPRQACKQAAFRISQTGSEKLNFPAAGSHKVTRPSSFLPPGFRFFQKESQTLAQLQSRAVTEL